jgi:hypothetical protein
MIEQVMRLETQEGWGPFIAQPPHMVAHVPWLRQVGDGVASKDDFHPHHMQDIPETDLGGDTIGGIFTRLGSPWKVGVKDKQQFLHWFPKSSLAYFDHEGFKLDVYKVPASAVKTGTYQVMFDSSKATLVKSESPTVLERD